MMRMAGVARPCRSRAGPGLLLALILGACSQDGNVLALSPPPALVSLSVAAPQQLSPAFSPDVYDYAIRCTAGANALQFDAAPTPGATLAVHTASASGPGQSASLDTILNEDEALVLDATDGVTTAEYWVRCLPHDFPRVVFTPHPSVGSTTPGWYLTGNGDAAAGEGGFAMVLDVHGTPVWYQRVGAKGATNIDRQPGGEISYIASGGTAYGMDAEATYVVQTLSPWKTRTVKAVGGPIDEHELRTLPDGDVLIFSYIETGGFDLSGLPGLTGFGPDSTIADCTIEEIDPSGALVWSWRASDHIDPVKESLIPLTNVIDGVAVADVFHLNAVDVDAKGNLLVSSRAASAVFYVDKQTGKIVWKMNGTAYSKDGAQLIRIVDDPESGFSAQHDARFQPNGDVSLFDDHTNTVGSARGVQYAIDFTAGTAQVVWDYFGAAASEATGSFRRYSDGSNVIDWGVAPLIAATFSEIDSQGHDVLDAMIGSTGDFSYRTVKVPVGDFDVGVLRATAGHP
jgi:hypothetical protein